MAVGEVNRARKFQLQLDGLALQLRGDLRGGMRRMLALHRKSMLYAPDQKSLRL